MWVINMASVEYGPPEPKAFEALELQVEDYKKMGWCFILHYDPETNQYEGFIPELQVGTCGSSRQEVFQGLEDVLHLSIESHLETGCPIPEPPIRTADDFLPLQSSG